MHDVKLKDNNIFDNPFHFYGKILNDFILNSEAYVNISCLLSSKIFNPSFVTRAFQTWLVTWGIYPPQYYKVHNIFIMQNVLILLVNIKLI